jgi:hypothetical protein
MPEYEPLMVRPVESKKKPGNVIAFIGRQMCFFENKEPQPPIGETVEVMILKPIYARKPDGHFDFRRVFALILRVVTPEWTLIEHDGFECSGSMCRTTARMTGPKELVDRHYSGGIGPWLTPGRCEVFEAGNVNVGTGPCDHPYVPLRPGRVWVSTERLMAGEFPLRAEGLCRVEDGMYAHAVKKDEVKA